MQKKTNDAGLHFNYEVFLAYTAMMFAVDAIERAGSADRGKIMEAMANSTWDGSIMPYGATFMVNGQNMGAQPLVTQVVGSDIKVIAPSDFASAKAVFPRPA